VDHSDLIGGLYAKPIPASQTKKTGTWCGGSCSSSLRCWFGLLSSAQHPQK
jgi:hypothetical protein